MPKKLDERHQKWLISDEEREYETFVAEGLGEWTDLEKTFLSLEAMRLEFAGTFDYDLTALGGAADKAVSELKALFGSQGTIFNNAIISFRLGSSSRSLCASCGVIFHHLSHSARVRAHERHQPFGPAKSQYSSHGLLGFSIPKGN